MRFGIKRLVKELLSVIVISLIGCAGIIFSVLYVDNYNSGFFSKYSELIKSVSVGLIVVLIIFTLVFYRLDKSFIYKLFFLSITFFTLIICSMFLLNEFGVLEKIDSVEDLRTLISSNGKYASVIFLIIQFLQVVVLPIPAFITVGAGVLLFGAFKGAVLSTVGIILGSIVAFFIGRLFGYKVVKWLVGEDSLKKGLSVIKGKDKVLLTFMFLFPFFPDDVLCFVAGITTISPTFFVCMIIITRVISVFTSSFSMNGSLIPFNTWWGILLWILFIFLTVLFTWFVYKKGDKIENFIRKLKKKK